MRSFWTPCTSQGDPRTPTPCPLQRALIGSVSGV
jgi:hypothetical protein